MKDLNRVNLVAHLLPLVMALATLFDHHMIYIAIYSLAIVGIVQVLLAIVWLLKSKRNIYLFIYLILTVVCLFLIYINIEQAWFAAPALAVYFSVILFIEGKKEKS